MASLAALQDDVYFWLGTTRQNAAFQPEMIRRRLNDAKNALYSDCFLSFPDPYGLAQILAPDAGDDRLYRFADQLPAITNAVFVVEVRVRDADGIGCGESPLGDLPRRAGRYFALTGMEATLALVTGPGITAGVPLYCLYVPAAPDLVDSADTPTWLPAAFHDVLSMKAAALAVSSGNEQTMSPLLLNTLTDRDAQLRQALGRRSLSPTSLRTR